MKYLVVTVIFLFTTTAQKLSAQEITMFPGLWGVKYYEDNTQLTLKEVNTLISKDNEAKQLWDKSKRHETIGWLAFGAEIGFLIWELTGDRGNNKEIIPLIGVLTSAGVAIGFNISSNSLKKKSILTYNQNKTGDTGSVILGPTYNGMGLVWSF